MDRRSEQAEGWRRLYRTRQWQQIRKAQLAAYPLCKTCMGRGHVTPATVCNHADKASKATVEGFYVGPFTSECAPCHDSLIQRDERRADVGKLPIQACGHDGWPNTH